MELAIDLLPLIVDQGESVRSITVHVPVTIGNAPVRKQDHELVRSFRTQRPKVPEHIGVPEVRLGVSLLRVDEAREEDGVADEEYGGVVPDQVPDAVLGVEFDGETPRVAYRVRRSHFSGDGREPHADGGAFAYFGEDFGPAVLGDVVGDFEVAEGSGAFGMDYTFGDAFPVEVGHLVLVLEVLHELRAAFADGEDGIFLDCRDAVTCRVRVW